MNSKHIIYIILLLSLSYACIEDPVFDDDVRNAKLPQVVTLLDDEHSVEMFATSIVFHAEVVSAGGVPVDRYGVCWGTEPNPTIESNDTTVCGSGVGEFKALAKNLKPGTLYYFRPYATNKVGTSYGEEFQKNTTEGLGLMKTFVVDSLVKASSVVCGGKIIDPGEGDIIERGVYLSVKGIEKKDTIAFEMKADSFYQKITGLNPETNYEVEAYLKNSFGIITGGVKNFTTTSGKPAVEVPDTVEISFTEAVFSSSLISNGDSTVKQVGFCYATKKSPNLDSMHVFAELQPDGKFTASLKDLEPQKQYYVRAFATNHYGTSYSEGDGIPFVLKNQKPTVGIEDITINKNGTLSLSASILSEGMSDIVSAGFCWTNSVEEAPSLTNKNGVYNNVLEPESTDLTAEISGLKGSETYYIVAYATNSEGTSYSAIETVELPKIFEEREAASGEPLDILSISTASAPSVAYVLGGNTHNSELTNEFLKYDISKDDWNSRAAFPFKRKWQTLIAYNSSNILAFGGMGDNSELSNDMYSYVDADNQWRKVAYVVGEKGVPAPMCNSAAFLNNLNIYIVGGRLSSSSEKITDEVWVFNTLNSSWSKSTPLPEPQYGSVALNVDDSKHFVGLGRVKGTLSDVFSKKWWSVSFNEDDVLQWTEETPFPSNGVLCATAFKGSVYLLDTDGYIWLYDIVNKSWTKKAKVPTEINQATNMFAGEDGIYINSVTGLKAMYFYNPVWDNVLPW